MGKSKGYYIIIRGPLGSGKSTISKRLANAIKAEYVEIDRELDKVGETWYAGYVSQRSFIRADEAATKRVKPILEMGIPVVFDGNFYHKSQIEDIINRLKYPHYVFTLKVPLRVCIERDSKRNKTHGADAAKAVYKKSTRFKYGTIVDATKPLSEVIKEILAYLQSKGADNPDVNIRKLSAKDAKPLKNIIERKEVVWKVKKSDYPNSLPKMEKYIKNLLKIKDCYQLSILSRSKFVGMLSIEKINKEEGTVNIGYWVAKSHRSKGIATSAIKLATIFIFEKLKLNKIYAEVGKDNLPSIRVLEKAGFLKEGKRFYPDSGKTEYIYSTKK